MWWCPTCKQEVPDISVTYEEYHDSCGTYLGDCQEISDEDKIKACVEYLLEYNLTPDEYNEMYKLYNAINP